MSDDKQRPLLRSTEAYYKSLELSSGCGPCSGKNPYQITVAIG